MVEKEWQEIQAKMLSELDAINKAEEMLNSGLLSFDTRVTIVVTNELGSKTIVFPNQETMINYIHEMMWRQ